MKRENLDLNFFSSSARLKKVLDRLELSEDKIEAFLEEVNIHCFKKDISQKEFVSNIDKVSNLASDLNISINDMPRYVSLKTKQLEVLDKQLSTRQQHINQKIEEYDLTIQDLEQYRSNRPLVDKIRQLEHALRNRENEKSRILDDLIKIDNRNKELESKKNIPEIEFIKANKILPKDTALTLEELQEITDEIFYNPSRNLNIIKTMRDRCLSRPI